MNELFELPELFTLSGTKLTTNFDPMVIAAGGNSCGDGSGNANTCTNGTGALQQV